MNSEESDNKSVENYIKNLNEMEKKVLKIAEEHLGSSFDIKKSIGYLKR